MPCLIDLLEREKDLVKTMTQRGNRIEEYVREIDRQQNSINAEKYELMNIRREIKNYFTEMENNDA